MLVLSGLAIGVNAQDTIKGLIISEHRFGNPSHGYIELANVGTDTIDLSKVAFASVRNQDLTMVDGQWRLPGPRPVKQIVRPEGMLAPGKTWMWMAVSDRFSVDGPWPQHRTDILPLADHYIMHADVFGKTDTIIPEWQMWGDSVSSDAGVAWNWGIIPFALFAYLDNGDSIMIDQVNMNLNDANRAVGGYNAVAGIPEATRYYTLVRKATVTHGNMDWLASAGVSAEDSEWNVIPNQPPESRISFKTIKNHGDFHIDVTSSLADVDIANAKMTVPWGIYRGDSILPHLDIGPGMAWGYVWDGDLTDSTFTTMRDGDTLIMYASGNTLEEVHFEIAVLDPAADQAEVFPMSYKVSGGGWWHNPFNSQFEWTDDDIWVQPYYVTNFHAMDTIGNVPYATRVDTLFRYLEKAPDATWEIVFKDGEDHADLSNGDILKVTAQDGSTIKEYYIDVQEYAASNNAQLGAITWPDKQDFLEGWAGDTIPQFSSVKNSYTVKVPYGTLNVPALTAHPVDINAEVEVQRAVSLTGSLAERSSVFTVTAQSDTITNTYTVLFELEKHPSKVQTWEGTPFFSEFATNQRSWMGYLEIVNPGNVDMDLSEYMIVRSDEVNPALAIEALAWDVAPTDADFQNRYLSYVPGYAYYEDTVSWLLNPGFLNLDANVDPVVAPGEVFVIASTSANRIQFYTDAQLDIIDKRWDDGNSTFVPVDDGVNARSTPANLPRGADAVYLLKIVGDSVLDGTKAVGDPADFMLVDVLGDPVADDTWSVAGKTVGSNYRGRVRPKPYIYTGSNSLVECEEHWGTSVDTTDWIAETYLEPEVPAQDNIPDLIGSHVMNPVTVYLSTITSGIYLVSDGYGVGQTLQGDLTSTTVETFFGYVDKADSGQELSVHSGTDGSMKDAAAAVAGGDTLVVLSADGLNTSWYTLTDQPLDSDAVLTLVDDPSDYTINIDGSTGMISGVVFGSLLKDLVAAVNVPDLAVMNIINGAGELVPMHYMNYNSDKVDTKVGSDIYFEVVAQDLVTIITYKLEPATLSSDAFVISSVYNVDDEGDEISGIAEGTTVGLFFRSTEVVKGATATILSKSGHERVDGVISYDDVLKVVSEDGTNTTIYFLTFQLESNPDVNQAPVVTLAFSDSIMNETGTIQLSATVDDDGLPQPPSITYLWEVTSGNAADVVIENADQLSTNVTFSAMGDYTFTLSVNDGAATTEVLVSISLRATRVGDMLAPAMHIYPNPVKDKLTLELTNMPGRTSMVSIYSITGRAVYNAKLSADKTDIDISSLDAGLYLMKVESDNIRFTQRIEIQK